MTLPNVEAVTRDNVEASMTPEEIEALHAEEHKRELAGLDEQIVRLGRKVKRLKADTSLKDAEKALAEVTAARSKLASKGPV